MSSRASSGVPLLSFVSVHFESAVSTPDTFCSVICAWVSGAVPVVAEMPSWAFTSPVTAMPPKVVDGTGGGSTPLMGRGMQTPMPHTGWVIDHWSKR